MQLLQHFHELSLHPANAKELKALILQLAVQGKLTASWRHGHPELVEGDHSASVLLERIKAKKAQLTKEGKIKKEKPLPIITKNEIPYELPEGWIWCRFQNIMFDGFTGLERAKRFQSLDFQYSYFKMNNIGDLGRCVWNNLVKVNANESEVEKYSLNKGDFLFNTRNSYELVGKTCVIDKILKEVVLFNNNIFKVDFRNFCDPDYIKIMFNSPTVKTLLDEKKSATTNVAAIYQGKLLELIVVIPPLEEQKAIVKVVEQLFKEVEQLEQLTVKRIQLKEQFATSALRDLTTNNTIKEWEVLRPHFHTFFNEEINIKKLRETILHMAVQGKLTAHWRSGHPEALESDQGAAALLESIKVEKAQLIKEGKIKKEKPLPPTMEDDLPAGKAGIPYELPEGWAWCRLTDLVDVGTGSTPAKSESTYYLNGTIPWYTSSATNSLFAAPAETLITKKALKETNCKIFSAGSLIIAMYGQGKTRGQISELIIPGATNQALAAMVFYESSKEIKQYLKYFFQKIYHEIRTLAEGGAQPNLNVGKIKATFIPVPPSKEQKAIVETVNRLMVLCNQLEELVKLSKQQVEDWMLGGLREVVE